MQDISLDQHVDFHQTWNSYLCLGQTRTILLGKTKKKKKKKKKHKVAHFSCIEFDQIVSYFIYTVLQPSHPTV